MPAGPSQPPLLSSTHHMIVTSLFFTPSSSSITSITSLTQSLAATPTQTTLFSPVTSTKILASSSLTFSAQTSQLSTIFISSTESSKTTTASFNQSATTIKQTNFEFISSSQSQLTSFTRTPNYTHEPFLPTSLSTLIVTITSMLSSNTPMLSSVTKFVSQSMMSVTYSPMLTKSVSQSMVSVTYSPMLTKSVSQSMMSVIYSPMLTKSVSQSMMSVIYSPMLTKSLSRSTTLMVTSTSAFSMPESPSQLGTSTVTNFPPISLSTTGTSSQHLNSFFSTQEDIQTVSQSQHTSSYAVQAMKTSFTVATPAPSYGLLSLSSSPSSTPSGDGGSFSQPVIASISGAAGFITLIVFAFVIIIIVGYLCGYVEPHCT